MKNNKNQEYRVAGQDCQCYAHSESECACNVDWTDPLIYKQREEIRELRTVLDKAQKRNGALEVVIRGAQEHIDELKDNVRDLKEQNEIHMARIAYYMDKETQSDSEYPLHWGGIDLDKNDTIKNLFNTNVAPAEAKLTEETPRIRTLLNKLMRKKESEPMPTEECPITGRAISPSERSWQQVAEGLAHRLEKLEEQMGHLDR